MYNLSGQLHKQCVVVKDTSYAQLQMMYLILGKFCFVSKLTYRCSTTFLTTNTKAANFNQKPSIVYGHSWPNNSCAELSHYNTGPVASRTVVRGSAKHVTTIIIIIRVHWNWDKNMRLLLKQSIFSDRWPGQFWHLNLPNRSHASPPAFTSPVILLYGGWHAYHGLFPATTVVGICGQLSFETELHSHLLCWHLSIISIFRMNYKKLDQKVVFQILF